MSTDRRLNVPTTIGGSRVLYYALIDEKHVARNATTKIPYGIAICKGDGYGVFLFTCEEDWMPVFDSWHANVEEAKRQAAFEFGGLDSGWLEPLG
jgi:hypothetical protein